MLGSEQKSATYEGWTEQTGYLYRDKTYAKHYEPPLRIPTPDLFYQYQVAPSPNTQPGALVTRMLGSEQKSATYAGKDQKTGYYLYSDKAYATQVEPPYVTPPQPAPVHQAPPSGSSAATPKAVKTALPPAESSSNSKSAFDFDQLKREIRLGNAKLEALGSRASLTAKLQALEEAKREIHSR